jgi:hypothetical protein
MFFLMSLNSHAMKRKSDLELEKSETKKLCARKNNDQTIDINWLTYVELLSEFLKLKNQSLHEKIICLCNNQIFTKNQTIMGETIYQLWLTWPDNEYFLINIYTTNTGYKLSINITYNFEPKIFIINLEPHEIITTKNRAFLYNDALEEFINELLYNETPKFKPTQENCLDLYEFDLLLERLDDQSLSKKILTLNNSALGAPNPFPLMVELKEDVWLVLRISFEKYASNCLSEKNFLDKALNINLGSLYYYHIALHFWDLEKNAEKENASSIINIPLDAGYGELALPSELYWIQKEQNFSGKEMLDFVKKILKLIQPKIIYLNDSSAAQLVNIHILRPIMCGQTFYEHYGQFEVVDCHKLISHKDYIIEQSREEYKKSISYLRFYPIKKLLNIINSNKIKDLTEILNNINQNNKITDLGEFFKYLYDNKMTDKLNKAYEIICDYGPQSAIKNNDFKSHIMTLDCTWLFKSESYSRARSSKSCLTPVKCLNP